MPVIGQTVQYVDSQGVPKAATVTGSPNQPFPEDYYVPTPQAGHVHILVFGFRFFEHKFDVPLKETAEAIPDYTVEGKLVSYVAYVGQVVLAK